MSQPPPPASGRPPQVVVVGGGLAGLTCALDLAESGLATTLIEKRPFVGGKTFSFTDPQSGVELDNGQHVYLRCCTAYIGLLERLGLTGQVRMQSQLRVPVLDPSTGVVSPIASGPGWLPDRLPAPLNLGWSILRFAHLGLRDKLMLGRAVLPLIRIDDPFAHPTDGHPDLDAVSFGDWLRAHGQSRSVIERFWDLIVLPTCNDVSDDVSAAQAAFVFKTGLLDDRHGADIGLARVGLSHLADAILARFRAAGGRALLGRSLRRLLQRDDGRIGLAMTAVPNGEQLDADAVVLALPPNRSAALLPDAWRDHDGLAALPAFRYSPIVNVHLHYDRPVLSPHNDFLAVLDSDLQYVFNRSRIRHRPAHTEPDGSQWLDVSLSGAHCQSTQPQAAIVAAAIAGLRRAFPPTRDAELRHWRVVKESEATFRPGPGVATQRPGPTTGVANLFLAGAWTDTRWPATMESAVRSGQAAALAVRQATLAGYAAR